MPRSTRSSGAASGQNSAASSSKRSDPPSASGQDATGDSTPSKRRRSTLDRSAGDRRGGGGGRGGGRGDNRSRQPGRGGTKIAPGSMEERAVGSRNGNTSALSASITPTVRPVGGGVGGGGGGAGEGGGGGVGSAPAAPVNPPGNAVPSRPAGMEVESGSITSHTTGDQGRQANVSTQKRSVQQRRAELERQLEELQEEEYELDAKNGDLEEVEEDDSAACTFAGGGNNEGDEVAEDDEVIDLVESDGTLAAAAAAQTEYVQCDLCQKWRKLPPGFDAERLPEVWFCSANDFSNYNSCSIECEWKGSGDDDEDTDKDNNENNDEEGGSSEEEKKEEEEEEDEEVEGSTTISPWNTRAWKKSIGVSDCRVEIPPNYRTDEGGLKWKAMSTEERTAAETNWRSSEYGAEQRAKDVLKVPKRGKGIPQKYFRYVKPVYQSKKRKAKVAANTRSQKPLVTLGASSEEERRNANLVKGRTPGASNFRRKGSRPTKPHHVRDANVFRNAEQLLKETANMIKMTNADPKVLGPDDPYTTFVLVMFTNAQETKRGGSSSKSKGKVEQMEIMVAGPNRDRSKDALLAANDALKMYKKGETEQEKLKATIFFDDERLDDEHPNHGKDIKEQILQHYINHPRRNRSRRSIQSNDDTNQNIPTGLMAVVASPTSSGARSSRPETGATRRLPHEL